MLNDGMMRPAAYCFLSIGNSLIVLKYFRFNIAFSIPKLGMAFGENQREI